jgi:hypothetical protein
MRGCLAVRLLSLVVLTSCGRAERAFAQYESDRYHLPTPPAGSAPWPVLPFAPVQLESSNGTAIVLDGSGVLHVIQASGSTAPLVGIAPLPSGSRIGIFAPGSALRSSHGIVACTPSSCTWYACAAESGGSPSCTVVAASAGGEVLGKIRLMVVAGAGTAFLLGESAGLVSIAPGATTPRRFGSAVAGRITALAYHEHNTTGTAACLAVASELAVYYDLDPATREFQRHELVGASLDAPPTSLAFVEPAAAALREAQMGADGVGGAGGAGGAASAAGRQAELWIGHAWCLNVLRLDGSLDRVSGAQGLPVGNVTALRAGGAPGELWVGSVQGLALRCPRCDDEWRFFGLDRWLPRGAVASIAAAGRAAFSAAGAATGAGAAAPAAPGAWVLTSRGAARIWAKHWTLAQKAAAYQARLPALERHRYVAATALARYGDTGAASLRPADGDNDGSWTGFLASSFIYEYAATGSDQARQKAWRYFSALEFLHNVTGTRGFMARAVVKCGEPHRAGDSPICPEGSPHACGWVNSSVCYAGVDAAADVEAGQCCWEWKRDTSTDETDGHFATLLLAHELLARTGAERARAARLLCDSMAYIQDGGWVLVDPVSRKGTSWGYWDPAQLNGVPGKPDERGQVPATQPYTLLVR